MFHFSSRLRATNMETGIRNLKAALRRKVKETIDCMTIEERLLQSDYIAEKVKNKFEYKVKSMNICIDSNLFTGA